MIEDRDGAGGYESGQDMDSLASNFAQVADRMQQQVDAIRQAVSGASAGSYEASAEDGSVKVRVDGRPRVKELYVGAKAVRLGRDALAASVLKTVNEALDAARQGVRDTTLAHLDPEMRTVVERGIQESEGDR